MQPASSAVELANYLRRRLERLEYCNADLERRVSEDEAEFCRKVDEGVYKRDDPELGRVVFHLEYVLANTFRTCMLSAVCSFLEEALKSMGSLLVPQYDAELKKREGRWLKKNLLALRDMAGVDCQSVQASVDRFDDLIVLRNCVVHSGGSVAGDRKPEDVRAAVKRIDSPDIAEISRDDFLIFGDQLVPEAITVAEDIAECILTSKLGASVA